MTFKNKLTSGIGTGYLSVMMIFVLLTLSLLAALSLSAAKNGQKYSRRSAEYTAAYYEADIKSKKNIEKIILAAEDCFDYTDITDELDEMDGIGYTLLPSGINVNVTTPINTRQNIVTEIRLHDGTYEIISCKTVSDSAEDESEYMKLWNGEQE